MKPFHLGAIYGGAIVVIFLLGLLLGHAAGRGGIVNDCLEHRAFVYKDGAWGCVRLRKGVRDMGRDEILEHEKVKT